LIQNFPTAERLKQCDAFSLVLDEVARRMSREFWVDAHQAEEKEAEKGGEEGTLQIRSNLLKAPASSMLDRCPKQWS
jgi:hypothetical protein